MVCIIFDGNIGSGKTTLIKFFENAKFTREHVVVLEPVDEWMKVSSGATQSLFEKYYNDKKRYGFLFQMFALETRVKRMYAAIKENPGKIIICERSHLTDCYVFAQMLMQDNLMEQQEYDVYKSWFEMARTLMDEHIKGIVYLRASPQTCLGRIFKRMRKGEERISYDYIDTLHGLHERWLMDSDNTLPVCVIDANVDENEIQHDAIYQFVNMIATP